MHSAIEGELNSLIIGDHPSIKPHLCSPLGHNHLGTIGNGLDKFEENGLLQLESGRVPMHVDILQDDILFSNYRTQDGLPEICWVFAD